MRICVPLTLMRTSAKSHSLFRIHICWNYQYLISAKEEAFVILSSVRAIFHFKLLFPRGFHTQFSRHMKELLKEFCMDSSFAPVAPVAPISTLPKAPGSPASSADKFPSLSAPRDSVPDQARFRNKDVAVSQSVSQPTPVKNDSVKQVGIVGDSIENKGYLFSILSHIWSFANMTRCNLS